MKIVTQKLDKGLVVVVPEHSDDLSRKYPIASKVLLLAEQLQSIRERAREYQDIYVIDSNGYVNRPHMTVF